MLLFRTDLGYTKSLNNLSFSALVKNLANTKWMLLRFFGRVLNNPSSSLRSSERHQKGFSLKIAIFFAPDYGQILYYLEDILVRKLTLDSVCTLSFVYALIAMYCRCCYMWNDRRTFLLHYTLLSFIKWTRVQFIAKRTLVYHVIAIALFLHLKYQSTTIQNVFMWNVVLGISFTIQGNAFHIFVFCRNTFSDNGECLFVG